MEAVGLKPRVLSNNTGVEKTQTSFVEALKVLVNVTKVSLLKLDASECVAKLVGNRYLLVVFEVFASNDCTKLFSKFASCLENLVETAA